MPAQSFSDVIEQIRRADTRYGSGAYHFVRQALDYTLKQPERAGEDGQRKHVSGQDLLGGIREYALEQFGPLTLTVFRDWGIRRCEDFGEIVFNLVDFGVLGKTDNDKREDFAGGYDFDEAFAAPFRPEHAPATSRARLAAPAGEFSGQSSQG